VQPIGPGVGQKSWPVGRGRIDRVFKALLGRPLEALRPSDLQMVADAYPAKQIAASAVRCLRPVLKWGAARDYVSGTAADLKPPAVVKRREHVLTREELKALLPHLQETENPYRRAMFFMLLTLARREEVAGALWRDVDLTAGLWRLPKTKNGLDHVIPLSDQALDLLHSIGAKKGDTLIFASSTGGRLSNWDREAKSLMKASATAGWTRHDLRRTGATLLGEMGVEPHVIESALNHALIGSQIGAVYNRARYRPAVGRALQMLAEHLAGVAGVSATVIPLKVR
jgi:integrase